MRRAITGPGIFLLALLLPAPVTLRAQDAAAIVGRAARVYRDLGSLKADFAQVIDDQMLGRSESRGTLIQAGPNRLSMRFSDPAGDAIVVDGKYVWIYTPSTVPGQVIRSAVPSGGPVYGVNLLGWFLDRPSERYRMRYVRADTLDGRPVDVVELTPRSPEMPFQRAVVWIDRGSALPRRLEIEERPGSTRTLTLSHMQVDPKIPAGTFAFTVPDGVRVVDQ